MCGCALVEVPASGGFVHAVPGVLVHDQSPPALEQARDLVQSGRKVCDVMQLSTCDHRIKRARVDELLERNRLEQGALRGFGIDRCDCMASAVDSQSELTSTTADLEDRRRRKLRVDERRQIHEDRSKAGAHGITVLVRTGETVDILLDVTNVGVWMAHCHIAGHHESGMMFSFNVEE